MTASLLEAWLEFDRLPSKEAAGVTCNVLTDLASQRSVALEVYHTLLPQELDSVINTNGTKATGIH